ncbi:hypothetical protein GCM10009603_56530 [Nocardiopsis exhalans]
MVSKKKLFLRTSVVYSVMLSLAASLMLAQPASANEMPNEVTAMSNPIACSGPFYRAVEALRHRSGPGTGYSQVGSSSKGRLVCVVGREIGGTYTACGQTSNVWARITPEPPRRYVAATCLALA